MNLIKELARRTEFGSCEPHMRDLVQMSVTRLKVAAVDIPPDSLKRGKEVNRRFKQQGEREGEDSCAVEGRTSADS